MESSSAPRYLGRHVLVEYFDCPSSTLDDPAAIEKHMVAAARTAGATVIQSTFHHFSPHGVSGVVVIEESHLAIHTWPEFGYAAVDLFTCGDSVDPWIAYKELKQAFEAGSGSRMEMLRGQFEQAPASLQHKVNEAGQDSSSKEAPRYHRDVWFTERAENIATSFRHAGRPVFRQQSDFQLVEVYDTYEWGKTLTLDRMVMTTEKDEFIYHEMISHPALTSHPEARNVLVIGGGDGGAVREVLRHQQIEEVTMVEIDGVVIEASKQHLPSIAAAFEDPRLNLIVGDGIAHVQNATDASYDIILVDSTDPVGPAEGLFSEEFYTHVHRILRPGGRLVVQSESPTYEGKVFTEINQCFKRVFGSENVDTYLAHIPTYPTGMWSFMHCVKEPQSADWWAPKDAAAAFCDSQPLRYYTPDLHKAARVLPRFVQDLLKAPSTAQTASEA